ncbi:MAG: hypothetical protein E6712_11100 [Clostridium sp.]|uniref:hypothetical protein n=1 Tax=Clostridium sp. TaxID=1506 RepID=UPI0028FDDCB1|nr:hypothetical protein [Clostridium sp.]MDU1936650.1 hypothetical protein [Clostridium sp.]MDU2045333.1 hypothetical protein [Clostridium sp.]
MKDKISNDKNILISMSVLLFIIIALVTKDIKFIILISFSIIFELIFIYLLIVRNRSTYLYIINFVIFQNIIVVILSKYISTRVFNLIILNKEILLYISCFMFILVYINKVIKQQNKIDSIVVISLIILTFYLIVFSKNNFKATVASYRQYIIPYIFYLFGRIVIMNEKDIKKSIKVYVIILFVSCIISLIIYFLGDSIWSQLGIDQYLNHKGVQYASRRPDGLPRSFYTYDYINLIGIPVRRLVGVLVDPVIYGQVISCGLVFLILDKEIISNNINRFIMIFVMSISLILTFSKGGFVIFAISVAMGIKKVYNKKILGNFLIVVCILCFSLIILGGRNSETSIGAHYSGLIENIEYMVKKPLGHGIGINGNFANQYGADSFETVGEDESFIGKVMVEVGGVGIILYAMLIGNLYKSMKSYKFYDRNIKHKYWIFVILGISIFCGSLFSVSCMSFTGCAFVFISLGIITNLNMANSSCISESRR